MVGLCTYCKLISVKEDELARGIFIESSNTPTSFPTISWAQILGPTQVPTPT